MWMIENFKFKYGSYYVSIVQCLSRRPTEISSNLMVLRNQRQKAMEQKQNRQDLNPLVEVTNRIDIYSHIYLGLLSDYRYSLTWRI